MFYWIISFQISNYDIVQYSVLPLITFLLQVLLLENSASI